MPESDDAAAERNRGDITQLLAAWGAGDQDAFDRLFPLVYPMLKKLAERELRGERPGHTLQTTALVHEAFLELAAQRRVQFESRAHFLGVTAFMMRRILTEHARARHAHKRGGGVVPVSLDTSVALEESGLAEIEAVDEALKTFERIDPRAAKVVVLRFFGGLSHGDTAAALSLSEITVKRDWAAAKLWLKRALEQP